MALSTSISIAASVRDPPLSTSPIVMFGPSGTGKSTLLKRLHSEPAWEQFGFSVSHTTRQPRPGEEDGVAYHFTTREKFLELVEQGAFIEHAEFGGNLYGTTAAAVAAVSSLKTSSGAPKRCILDIDAQGVNLILCNHAHFRPLVLFISPPSLRTLGERLNARGTETEESLKVRLGMAKGEIEFAATGVPNVIIVNDDLDRTYSLFRGVCVDGKLEGDAGLPKEIVGEDIGEVASASAAAHS